MQKIYLSVVAFALMLVPGISSAQDEGLGDVSTTFDKITVFINDTLIPLVFAIALLVFLYGIFKYFILGGGDESKRSEGRQLMLYAIIGFVVMVAIFGIVNLIINGLGLESDEEQVLNIPDVPSRGE